MQCDNVSISHRLTQIHKEDGKQERGQETGKWTGNRKGNGNGKQGSMLGVLILYDLT